MKNSFKFGFLALAISLSVAACNSTKTEEAAADSTAVMDTTVVVDSVATLDTTVVVDSVATK
jgi:hypothetical protein